MAEFDNAKTVAPTNIYSVSTHVALGSAATYAWMFTTPAGDYPVVHVTMDGGLLTQFDIYKDCTLTGTTGSVVTPLNLNFNSSDTTSCTLHWRATGAPALVGTKVFRVKNGSASTPAHAEVDLKLKPSTKYLFYATSGAASNYVAIDIKWY